MIFFKQLEKGILIILFCFFSAQTADSNSTALLLSSAIIPGSGQALFGHPYKGAALFALEATMISMAYFEGVEREQRSLADWEDYKRELHYTWDNFNSIKDTMSDSVIIESRQELDDMQYKNILYYGNFLNYRQLRNMYMIWSAGVYMFNLMDALDHAIDAKYPSVSRKSPKKAVWLSMLLPGLGQLYNGSISKAGMIWMAQGACIASAVYRYELTQLYEDKLKYFATLTPETYTVQGDSGIDSVLVPNSTDLASRKRQMEDRYNSTRRKFNSFVWYSIGIYLYNIFDALVDAHLHDFDAKQEIALEPGIRGDAVFMQCRFTLKNKSFFHFLNK